ncbi:MAG: DUF4125 family protein [Christensenella sp.]|uniref:DUF4125 family protein n=1 Tax=Christensenella sp. TaxID=1935934 RepID=UPI002B1F0029|nr:DUF4125 family protein [Christensenella sp.]MEA5004451.1 DUF4125 family protein [Christensenella sp.]
MIVQQILDIEWKMFDSVNNIGGRASCQDDQKTFTIQRGSQLRAWNDDMLHSYLDDLTTAASEGRNLLSEKYGYMMEHTSPTEYAAIQAQLPLVSAEKKALIEKIAAVQVAWLEDLSARYPHVTGNGRPIHQNEDSVYGTSFETYLKGELASYSQKTLQYYASYVAALQREQRNLNELILKNTCLAYGYASIDDAEQKMSVR